MNHALMPLELSLARDAAERTEPADLPARLGAGDSAALGEAYDLHHAHVRAFARRLVGDEASAEDIVQETFLGLPRAIGGFRGAAPLRTFLFGIAVNHARHHVRAADRRRAAVSRLESEPIVSASASPEADVEGAELARALGRALAELSLDHRAAFVLCEIEEQTSSEAAAVLGIPEGTVRTRLLHAKKQLRAWFTREGVR
jgi:RNA polymerase sigma-70 factor (ECF subfamily)